MGMTTKDDVLAERRAEPRRRVLKGATLGFNRGYGAMECVVRNESKRGALLAFGETTAVPTSFELRIAGQDQPRQARVRWRSLTSVGVELD
jgi:hypothetical protein